MIEETDLTTLDAVKAWMVIKPESTSADDPLAALIKSCSADFLRATSRPDLLKAEYTEVRQGDGGTRICLYRWPILAITSLKIAGVAVSASADKMAAGYFIDDDIDPERTFNLYLSGRGFTDGAAIEIAYSAGYDGVPGDINQAVIDWVVYRYKQSPNLGASQRKTVEGESVQQSQDDAPATTKACIERYRRCIPSVSRRRDEEQAWMRLRKSKAGRS